MEEIAGGDFVDDDEAVRAVEASIHEAAQAALKARVGGMSIGGGPEDQEAEKKLREQILETLGGPDGGIPIDLLSPPASREPSPRRLRTQSKSPARWKLMRSISDAVQDLMGRGENGMYGA